MDALVKAATKPLSELTDEELVKVRREIAVLLEVIVDEQIRRYREGRL